MNDMVTDDKAPEPIVCDLVALDAALRAAEIKYYRQHPEKEMPLMVPLHGVVIHWPTEFK